MHISVKRTIKTDSYTIGELSIDGLKFCDTLEDTDRGLSSSMSEAEIANIKVKGKTAIPMGTYPVTLDVVSPKFSKRSQYDFCGGKLPRLIGVKSFQGVLLHVGNTATDTDGCILVGQVQTDRLLNSTATFRALYARLAEDKDNLSITIE